MITLADTDKKKQYMETTLLFCLEPSAKKDDDSAEDTGLTFPVSPSSYSVQAPQNAETVNVNAKGTISLIGERGLKTLTLSTILPAQQYSFCVAEVKHTPKEYEKMIEDWKDNKTKLWMKLGEDYSFLCTITDLKFGESDGSGDYDIEIQLTEYRPIASSRYTPPASKDANKKYTAKHGDTLQKIAKKHYGKASYWENLWKLNKKAIEAKYKAYKIAKCKKLAKEYNKKHPSLKKKTWKNYYKTFKPANSQKGKHVIKGTVILCPSEIGKVKYK